MGKVIFWGFSQAAQVKAYELYQGDKVLYSAFSSKEKGIYGLDDFEQESYTKKIALEHQNTHIPKALENIFNDNFNVYKNQFSRCLRGLGACSDSSRVKKHFWTLLQWYFFKYHDKRVNFAIFAVPPHFGFDKLMSDVLKWLGIPVYYGYQTLFPNKFILYNYQFETIAPPNASPCTLHPEFPPVDTEELSYMKNISEAPPKPQWIRWLRKGLRSYFQIGDRRGSTRNQVIGEYHYYKNLRKAGLWNNDKLEAILLGKPFIYFPLHLQPEMTTSMLGGKYVDQILALEHLEQILPPGYKIVVKENPKQIYKDRSDDFFIRLKNLKNVIFIGKYLNSKWLIKKSKLVATITGTAGWEAIRFGKPVIVFGHAWYKNFYGVFQFHRQLNIKKTMLCHPSPEQLQLDFQVFSSECWNGVIDSYYQKQSLVSEEESVANLVKLLKHLNQPFKDIKI